MKKLDRVIGVMAGSEIRPKVISAIGVIFSDEWNHALSKNLLVDRGVDGVSSRDKKKL